MLEKFLNKYRISSARLQNWDYGSNAPYYVTICAANREFFFGTIRNGEMHFSEIGEIVLNEWLKTPVIRPDMNIYLDEFVLMPNHFHGIILIGNNEFNNRLMNVENHHVCRAAMHCVSTGINHTKPNIKNQFGPQIKNLSSVIRGFKSVVTINARKIDPYFAWQPRFHDSIIRDYRSYENIKNYIITNPQNWDIDDYWQ